MRWLLGTGLKLTYYRFRGMHKVVADRLVTACLPISDVYIVSGFRRSGTTWLQQNLARAIGAKTVFEPFARFFPKYQRRATALRIDGSSAPYDPYLDRPEDMAQIKPYLDSIFRGHIDHEFGLKARDSWRDSLRRKLVVKFIRASLSLDGIHSAYGFPIVHIRRHPCAVVASSRDFEQNWAQKFDEPYVSDTLLTPTHGHMELFEVYRDAIMRYDAGDMCTRAAAYWALTERYVENCLAGVPWARIVHYEDLVTDPARHFAEILHFFGCEADQVPNFDANSSMTGKNRQAVPMAKRAEDWRSRLPAPETDKVMSVVAELFPEFELV